MKILFLVVIVIIWQVSESDAGKKSVSHATNKLVKLLSSNKRIRDSGKSAKFQLYQIKLLLAEWRKMQQGLGKSVKIEEFWKYLKQKGRILKANNSSKIADSPESAIKDEDIDVCPFPSVVCPESVRKYRTFDGTCNNLHDGQTQWGGKNRAQDRLLDPDFADGIEEPRVARDGSPLPSASNVSNSLFGVKSDPSPIHTMLLATWGQFVDHDLTFTPIVTADEAGKNEPVFCGDDNCGIPGETSEDCFGIPPDQSRQEGDCMYFVRSKPFLKDDCSLSQREISNSITSYIDGSNIYGTCPEECNSLRDDDPNRGRMKMSENPVDSSLKPMLPFADNEESECSGVDDVIRCFEAGDVRRNEHIGLTSLHTLLVRLHNYIEEKLYVVNGHWDGEILFQETRKIVIAIWQHIVYNEYLPVILGPGLMHEYKLNPTEDEYSDGYDSKTRGDILTVFSESTFRFGHGLIKNMVTFSDSDFNLKEEKFLSEIMFNPSTMYNSPLKGMAGIDAVVNGMICAHAEKFDRNFAEQIKQHLFTDDPPNGSGFDLSALNIQRGRDHGIRGYTDWRVKLGLNKDKKYWDWDSDLRDIDRETLDEFKQLYKTPEDIDLFAAGVSEKPVPGGVVGKTFGRIIALQFQKLKKGDRFFYEHKHQYGFTEKQLTEIKKFTVAKVLCSTLDNVTMIQPYVFLKAKEELPKDYDFTMYKRFMHNNYRRPCSSLHEHAEIDYSVFENSNYG